MAFAAARTVYAGVRTRRWGGLGLLAGLRRGSQHGGGVTLVGWLAGDSVTLGSARATGVVLLSGLRRGSQHRGGATFVARRGLVGCTLGPGRLTCLVLLSGLRHGSQHGAGSPLSRAGGWRSRSVAGVARSELRCGSRRCWGRVARAGLAGRVRRLDGPAGLGVWLTGAGGRWWSSGGGWVPCLAGRWVPGCSFPTGGPSPRGTPVDTWAHELSPGGQQEQRRNLDAPGCGAPPQTRGGVERAAQ